MDAALPGHEDITDALIENLIRHCPVHQRKDVIKMLMNQDMSSERVADVLEKLLRDPVEDHRIRLVAARTLGQIGFERSVQALLQSLGDEYPSVRHEAIAALGKIGDMGSCAQLMNLLESESCYVRGAAARALIQISGVPAPEKKNIALLTKLLCSGDILVKEVLLRIGTPALAILAARMGDDSFYIRSQASQVLAMHVRRQLDQLFNQLFIGQLSYGMSIFDMPKGRGLFAKTIAKTIGDLYSFRITRTGEGIEKVENSGFDSISRMLCGERQLQPSISAPMPRSYKWPMKTTTLESLLSEHNAGSIMLMGRTLVAPVPEGCLAVKFCVKDGDESRLLHEARMQEHLQGLGLLSRVPRPLGGLFRIDGLPTWIKETLSLSHAHASAICYIASIDYFQYLSDPSISEVNMRSGVTSCASDLGMLAGMGLIHTSLISLFHNRERTTGGDCTYRWNRKLAGRLDNWLESCRYPNLRRSGIADLEHLELYPEVSSQLLQAYIGEHLFSMSLVLGCSFCKRGSVSFRLIGYALKDCFQEYYRSLTGIEPKLLDDCIDWDNLACRMAEEMAAQPEPHLGRCNGPFPIPELLRAVHIASTSMVLELQAQSKARA